MFGRAPHTSFAILASSSEYEWWPIDVLDGNGLKQQVQQGVEARVDLHKEVLHRV